ncbi:protein-methionine-sulfoxide reductase heme-binding subunit MsrQ [Varunaivibrio sulfuroxidans]|uniref:Protein-methionine-sulfoxide reductase heme-binding subunit MsrQ n=1 Tax=Varunaivibrio sulfuroxidans TaxID=1773489 RepID=A0A4R3J701_9PROT|nr:protein-methionine-sulfoxide reductase heme-binding subunit MsrQ [Varunaivibrio sulfuroxidans]TCS60653.1 sulfoxide reductase heme-binding subunit YedZ [Varunaivibrio sulfuroxidans]WES30144.1 sulfoxide reductase heme-binding subunit YedZ [Varunaivibrio sulfuroxidans]
MRTLRTSNLSSRTRIRIIKTLVFTAALLPLAYFTYLATSGGLGANPIEFTTRYLGDWALRALILVLAASPLRQISGWIWPIRVRRMLGLFAFFYITAHLLSYVALDHFFDWREIGADIVKRTYITVGMTAFAITAALAVTSTKGWIRRLGAKRWQTLHRLVYGAAILGVVHFFMMVKADLSLPMVHGAALAALLAWRIAYHWRAGIRVGTS